VLAGISTEKLQDFEAAVGDYGENFTSSAQNSNGNK